VAILDDVETNHAGATAAEIERVVREHEGDAGAFRLPGGDLRTQAGAIVDMFMKASEMKGLSIQVSYDVATERPLRTLHLPLERRSERAMAQARAILEKAKAMVGDGVKSEIAGS